MKIIFISLLSLILFNGCGQLTIQEIHELRQKEYITKFGKDTKTLDDFFKKANIKYDIVDEGIYKIDNPMYSDELRYLSEFCKNNKGEDSNSAVHYYLTKDLANTFTMCYVNDEIFFAKEGLDMPKLIYSNSAMKVIKEKDKKAREERLRDEYKKQEQIELERQRKINQEKAIQENKEKMLRERKGQFAMTFFESWRFYGEERSCATECLNQNKKGSGYRTLQNAIDDKWKFISNLGPVDYQPNAITPPKKQT